MLSNHRIKTQRPRGTALCLLGMALLSAWPTLSSSSPALPALPQTSIDTTYAEPAGRTVTVNAGDNLQAALDNADLGDTIILQAGATFAGPFTLPNKTSGSGWVYIRSSNYSNLPSPGNRVTPADAANMPKIVASVISGGAVNTASNAHHYRFVGIEFTPPSGKDVVNVIAIGDGETSLSKLPHDITFDRCYIHGDIAAGSRRGIAMNGAAVAVVDSYLSDFKEADTDTQAVWSSNGPGPFKITNNHLEAAGENIMFGGADPTIANLVPSDIEIKGNYIYKPLSWVDSAWTVKNLLEFKNARRALVENNTFENVWGAAQAGFAVLITPKNQEGTAPWTTTEDITFKSNLLKNIGGGINICGKDCGNPPTQLTTRLLIENNVFEVSGLRADGRIFQFVAGPANVTVNHNTGFSNGPSGMADFGDDGSTQKVNGFSFTNNILTNGNYGFRGTGTGEGRPTFDKYFSGWSFTGNALIGAASAAYPSGNFFPANKEAVGFVNYAGGDFNLTSSSPYKNAGSDGKDLGANPGAIGDAKRGTSSQSGLSSPISAPLNLRIIQ